MLHFFLPPSPSSHYALQFWVDCIQSTTPGAAILPVASFDDAFVESAGGEAEAKRRCNMLQQRLLQHEARRINGIRERLRALCDQNRGDSMTALRLRKLLSGYMRPKLIFGNDDDSVVRVSGTKYTGFDRLTEKLVGIGTGRYNGDWLYPLFLGHIGVRIPRVRLAVREAARKIRKRFKVVEWGSFIKMVREEHSLTGVDDVNDALHFLTNTGDLSFFGNATAQPPENHEAYGGDDDDNEVTALSMDDPSIIAPTNRDGSPSNVNLTSAGLSQFIFLSPGWLVAAVACILRHDLEHEIKKSRQLAASGAMNELPRTSSFYDAEVNCPLITADEACLLWQRQRITKKAAEHAQENAINTTMSPFKFLQLLLIRFGVFVPINLSIEKAVFGGTEYQQSGRADSISFLLPCLLGPCEPSEVWTYKTSVSWKATLCHSILFLDGAPPGLMERLTATVLSSINAASSMTSTAPSSVQESATYEGRLVVKEVFCWRTAFLLTIGMLITEPDGSIKESVVEIFTNLAVKESDLCVGSNFMGDCTHRLIISATGQAGDAARKIWKGGYLLVIKCVRRIMGTYEGVEFEDQGICTDCLRFRAVSDARSWDMTKVRSAVQNSEEELRCPYGHKIDVRLIAGPLDSRSTPSKRSISLEAGDVSVQSLFGAVVLVGLWDGTSHKVLKVGTGFFVDQKRGLIVTAAHTLMNVSSDTTYHPFGTNYFGVSRGEVVVGVLPKDCCDGKTAAVFRYFAKIVAKDPSFDDGMCRVDACILAVTARMQNDVGSNNEVCGDPREVLLRNDQGLLLQNENFPTLKLQEKYELAEATCIIGYNQGGQGLFLPGAHLNRCIDFKVGYVCMKFRPDDEDPSTPLEGFHPREEIGAMCPTTGGHSGGPFVNQQGEVIGILSRSDPADKQCCYLVPSSELMPLVNMAKQKLARN